MNRNILVIDDEPDVRAFLQAILEKEGYSIQTAENVDQGWSLLEKEPPDLITLDILMPEKSGINFFRRIRKDPKLQNIPVIVVTGFSYPNYPEADIEEFLNRRRYARAPEAVIRKPIDPQLLTRAVADAFATETAAEPPAESATDTR